jgi:hypothetical protein
LTLKAVIGSCSLFSRSKSAKMLSRHSTNIPSHKALWRGGWRVTWVLLTFRADVFAWWTRLQASMYLTPPSWLCHQLISCLLSIETEVVVFVLVGCL